MDYTCMFLYAIYGFTNFICQPLLARIILYTYVTHWIVSPIYVVFRNCDIRQCVQRLLFLFDACQRLSIGWARCRNCYLFRLAGNERAKDFKARDFAHWISLVCHWICDRNEWFDPKGNIQISKLKEELFINRTKRKQTYIKCEDIVRYVMITIQSYLDAR